MFGQGEQTLTDTGVRDTWELTPDQIELGGPGWTALLDRALDQFRDELGLPRSARLRAEPHAMLVYGKGQFFLPHQDSEKDDTMVGTLVVSLPSAHTGGELIIEHAGESNSYPASKDRLTFVAFYADCRHQVTPVRSGYRVTLTFNLLMDTETPAPEASTATELTQCLTEHFTTPTTSRYRSGNLAPPNRLVFLLDYEYTQRGLDWRRLKGADAERAALLRAAAEQAGCETVLALAEVKETWDVLPSDDKWGDYDDGLVENSDDFQLTELIDDEISLGWWTSPDCDGGEPISLHDPDYEACAVTPSTNLEPYQSEYEGYMGNYGNTLDRWYRRAAVVVWPRDRAFAARAEAGSLWALQELGDRIDAGDLAGARTATESLAPFWQKTETQAELLGKSLDVAAGLGAAGTATMLLEPFRVEMVTCEHANGLVTAAARYGKTWTRNVIDEWFGSRNHFSTDLFVWIDDSLPELCEALNTAGKPEVAQLLTTGAWNWLGNQLRVWTTVARTDERRPQLERLSSPLVRLVEAADDKLRDEIAGTLRISGDNVMECLMPALRLADARNVTGLDTIASDCAERLGKTIARPPRGEDDWSIEWTGCGCDLCDTARTFLSSRSQKTLEWPLAQNGRRHIHTQIDSAGLPLRHRTRRQGRPYTLVLTKSAELFTRATGERDKATADLAWLASTRA